MVQKGGQPPLFGITAATMEAAASIFPSGPIHLALLGGGKNKKKKRSIRRSKKKNNKRRRKTLRFMRASLGKASKGKKGRRKKGHSFKTKKKRPLR